jgi:hypothetical protein
MNIFLILNFTDGRRLGEIPERHGHLANSGIGGTPIQAAAAEPRFACTEGSDGTDIAG